MRRPSRRAALPDRTAAANDRRYDGTSTGPPSRVGSRLTYHLPAALLRRWLGLREEVLPADNGRRGLGVEAAKRPLQVAAELRIGKAALSLGPRPVQPPLPFQLVPSETCSIQPHVPIHHPGVKVLSSVPFAPVSDRKLITAAELEEMSHNERATAANERIASDLEELPPDFRARVLSTGERLAIERGRIAE